MMRSTVPRRPISLKILVVALALGALGLAGCSSNGVEVAEDSADYRGAQLFAERCAGCHTLTAAGAEGSAGRELRVQGPNLDERVETVEDVLFAIKNGGFSGAIMPQNIVVGEDAQAVAEFVAAYSGTELQRPPVPESDSE